MFLPTLKFFSLSPLKGHFVKALCILALVAASLFHFGCAGTPDRFYIPKPVAIKSGTVLNPTFKVAGFVDIENAQPDEWVQIGTETHDWLANLNRWTDTAVRLLQEELNKRGTVAMVGAPTVFELILCRHGEDGLTGHLFTDVKKRGCPLDTDQDGVPDLLDRCPGTLRDIPVNKSGCPLDTDGDGAPDHRDRCPGKPVAKMGDETPKGTAKKKPDPEPPASNACNGESSRFTVAGPVPPDTVVQRIQQELNRHGIRLSETATNHFTFITTQEMWNEIVDFLELELGKRGVKLIDGPPQTLRFSVTRAALFWTFHDVGCHLNLMVETGDDRNRNYNVSTLSPELYTSCDEAVSKAVAAMFMKERIIVDTDVDMISDNRDECPQTPQGVAVDKVGCPLDGDHDGVPDYLDQCPHTPRGVVVDMEGCPLDMDRDGVSDYEDECGETPEGVAVDRQGCPLDTDQDGVADYVDECPHTEKGVAVNTNGCRKNPKNRYVLIPDQEGAVGRIEVTSEKGSQVLDKAFEATGLNKADEVPSTPEIMDEEEVKRIFKDALNAQPTPPVHFLLYFKTDTTDLTQRSLDLLPRALKTIGDRNSVDLTVSGHTDRAGSTAHNRKLSLDRAGKVAELLISRGVDPKIIEITSHGEGNPLVETADGVAEPKNRRVEVVVR